MDSTPLILKSNGTVCCLGYQTPGKPPVAPRYEKRGEYIYEYLGGESAKLPYRYATADPIVLNGEPLNNVKALATSNGHALALKKDGTLVAWGNNYDGANNIPAGLSNVVAIACERNHCVVLKQNGTVTAWGDNFFGQCSVPTGLSNVIAIATASDFSSALIRGDIPPSVFIQPHSRLEEMEQKADLVFKGQVISNTPATNASFTISDMAVEMTKFKVISVLKGQPLSEVKFEHYSGYEKGRSFVWIGPPAPLMHEFEIGKSYLIFAARMDKASDYYLPPPGITNSPGLFRQIADIPKHADDGVLKTLDARNIDGLSVKEAHWQELSRLANDPNPTNVSVHVN